MIEGEPISMPLVPDAELEATIRMMPMAFTVLDFADVFAESFPLRWAQLVDRYGLYGSGTRYSVLTYLGNRIGSYSRRKEPNLLEPTPSGWTPEEGPFLRRTSPEERKRFGSHWIVVYRRRDAEDRERRRAGRVKRRRS